MSTISSIEKSLNTYLFFIKDKVLALKLTVILIIFILGIHYVVTSTPIMIENMENIKNKKATENKETIQSKDSSKNIKTNCPDMLIHHGNDFLLYNSRKQVVPGVNPIKFKTLDEYNKFVEWQNRNNIYCPVLFLQYTTDTQNNELLYVKPDFLDNHADMLNRNPKASANNIVDKKIYHPDLLDASREGKYNTNMYPGVDKHNQTIGIETSLDHKFNSNQRVSSNPMDTNWGGHEYTKKQIDKGVFKGRTRELKDKSMKV